MTTEGTGIELCGPLAGGAVLQAGSRALLGDCCAVGGSRGAAGLRPEGAVAPAQAAHDGALEGQQSLISCCDTSALFVVTLQGAQLEKL